MSELIPPVYVDPDSSNNDEMPVGPLSGYEALGKVVSGVVGALNDSIEGYQSAAEAIENESIADTFHKFVEHRQEFARELTNLLVGSGMKVDTNGSVMAAAHRGWMNLRSAINGGEEQTILEECERGDSHLLSSYEDALEEAMPDDVRDMLAKQFDHIQHEHEMISDLYENYEN